MFQSKITKNEISQAIKQLSTNKTPGPDGIPNEFYKSFPEITYLLEEIFNDYLTNKSMPKDFKKGLILPIYKKGDPEHLKNYRPITLLNTTYKILTTILYNRLKKILKSKISTNQHAFLPDRQIHDNIFEMQTIIDLADIHKTNGLIIFLDQEKAFDRVNHQFLNKCLATIGMSPQSVEIIMNLYKNAYSIPYINGEPTEEIECQKGTRQGDPLSGIIYICIMEAMIAFLEADPDLEQFEIEEVLITLLLLFADDTEVFLKNIGMIKVLMKRMDEFGKATNAKINVDKTEIIPLGSYRVSEKPQDIPGKWINDGEYVIHLGIPVGNKINLTEYWKNFDSQIKTTIEKVIKNNHYTPKGNSLLTKSLISSKFNFIAHHLHIPAKMIESWEKAIQNAHWNEKNKHRVGYETMIQPTHKGGMNAPHLKSLITAVQTKIALNFIQHPEKPWTKYLHAIIKKRSSDIKTFPRNTIINPFIQDIPKAAFKRTPQFWKNIITTWKNFTPQINFDHDHFKQKRNILKMPVNHIQFETITPRTNQPNDISRKRKFALSTIEDIIPTPKMGRRLTQKSIREAIKDILEIPKEWINTLAPSNPVPQDQPTQNDEEYSIVDTITLKCENSNIKMSSKSNNYSRIYAALVATKTPAKLNVPTPILNHYERISRSQLYKHLWNASYLTHKQREFMWRFTINRVAVVSQIHSNNMTQPTSNSADLPSHETRETLFIFSEVAQNAWKTSIQLWNIIANKNNDTIISIWDTITAMNGLHLKVKNRKLWQSIYITTLYSIWITRNNTRFNNTPFTTTTQQHTWLNMLKAILTDDILAQYENIQAKRLILSKEWGPCNLLWKSNAREVITSSNAGILKTIFENRYDRYTPYMNLALIEEITNEPDNERNNDSLAQEITQVMRSPTRVRYGVSTRQSTRTTTSQFNSCEAGWIPIATVIF